MNLYLIVNTNKYIHTEQLMKILKKLGNLYLRVIALSLNVPYDITKT